MPSVSNFLFPGTRGIHGSVLGLEGGRKFETGGWTYTCLPVPVGADSSPTVASCSEADLPLWRNRETPLRASFAAYLGDQARFGVDLGTNSLVGGWRSEHLGVMGWLHLTGGRFHLGGGAFGQRWNPRPTWRLGTYQYLAVNRIYRWSDYDGLRDGLSTYLDGASSESYREVGIGILVGYGIPAGFSLETKIGKEWGKDKIRAYLGINIHLESLRPFSMLSRSSRANAEPPSNTPAPRVEN